MWEKEIDDSKASQSPVKPDEIVLSTRHSTFSVSFPSPDFLHFETSPPLLNPHSPTCTIETKAEAEICAPTAPCIMYKYFRLLYSAHVYGQACK